MEFFGVDVGVVYQVEFVLDEWVVDFDDGYVWVTWLKVILWCCGDY